MTDLQSKPIANSMLVLREEFDDWAILFDPDTGDAFGMNPVSVLIWKYMDGQNTAQDIMDKIKIACENCPDTAEDQMMKFIGELIGKGYAGFEV